MVEAMQWYVSDVSLNPTPDHFVSMLKYLAEQFGFKMVVQCSKYMYPKDRPFICKFTFT